ncbi:MAG: phosphotransferase [Gemmataceae bacterium]|nr:phosphotransferase [Gemmataceae bacterium]MDW8266409.1 phosphotransferase [Gemmataceae bacterium]
MTEAAVVETARVRSLLAWFPSLPRQVELQPLGNHGGFSGARLWRLQSEERAWCLRAWPPSGIDLSSLARIHAWMRAARSSGCPFVPQLLTTASQETCVSFQGRAWEISEWLPGEADFHRDPTAARIRAAVTALARLHASWAAARQQAPSCPAVARRWTACHDWLRLLQAGWKPRFTEPFDPASTWAERAWRVVPPLMAQLPDALRPWLRYPVAVQPCLCDIWHAHVLFIGDTVTGIVDYGSMKTDHVAVDLARMLGSLAGENRGLWTVGLETYRSLRRLSAEEEELVNVLDRSGTVIGAANWLRWLYHEQRFYPNRQQVAARLASLVERLECWLEQMR